MRHQACDYSAHMSARDPRSPLLSARLAPQNAKARDRILAAAYDLFSRQGIRAVGIDAIIEQSGVARMTLYRHFTSKEQLVLAFLEQREMLWTSGWLQAEVLSRAHNARDRLLMIFEVFDEWFRLDGFEGCTFINVMLETAQPDDAVRKATVQYLARIRTFLAGLAPEAGIRDADGFARRWHIIMKGSIVSAAEGDRKPAYAPGELRSSSSTTRSRTKHSERRARAAYRDAETADDMLPRRLHRGGNYDEARTHPSGRRRGDRLLERRLRDRRGRMHRSGPLRDRARRREGAEARRELPALRRHGVLLRQGLSSR
jgi:AcrR family transcriptional regulator